MSAKYIYKNEAKHLPILLFCKINVALGEKAGIYPGSYIINRIACKILNCCIAEVISQFYSIFYWACSGGSRERLPPANSSFRSQNLSSSLSGVKDGSNKHPPPFQIRWTLYKYDSKKASFSEELARMFKQNALNRANGFRERHSESRHISRHTDMTVSLKQLPTKVFSHWDSCWGDSKMVLDSAYFGWVCRWLRPYFLPGAAALTVWGMHHALKLTETYSSETEIVTAAHTCFLSY